MVDKAGAVSFLEEGFYEEIVAEEEVVGGNAATEEVITDHYVTEDGTWISADPADSGHIDGGLITMRVGGVDEGLGVGVDMQQTIMTSNLELEQAPNIVQQPTNVFPDQNVVDPFPRPKHERCRCEARLYIHYHCAICSKPFAFGCMLRHFQHSHYPPGTVKTVYAHLIDEERELYGVISYAQTIPSPSHVIKLSNGSKRCSNSLCKSKRREGSLEECEHCLAIDDGQPSAPEPIFIDQQILENCHQDFVDSYKQYCNSAAQHGVPAVCVLRAPPHVTSHIIYSCFNENNIQKRYLVVQYEPTISCSCGVGAEKACWHRAIVSLCCQIPGQSENDLLDPPFQTLFSVREMHRFIDTTNVDSTCGNKGNRDTRRTGGGGRRTKMAKLTSSSNVTSAADKHQQRDNNHTVLSGRDSSEIEHAQLLSELGGTQPAGGVRGPPGFARGTGGLDGNEGSTTILYGTAAGMDPSAINTTLGALGSVGQQAVFVSSAATGAIPTHPQEYGGTLGGGVHLAAATGGAVSATELLMTINRLNDTIESLRGEIVTLKSQVAESSKYPSGVRSLAGEGESLYTISVNGPHNAKSALEDMSKKQVKVLLPPLNSASLMTSSMVGDSIHSAGGGHRVTFAEDSISGNDGKKRDDIGKSGVGCGLRIGTTNILEDDSSTVDLGSSPAVDSNARTGSRKGQLQPSGADEEDTFEEPSSGDENDESSAGRKLKEKSSSVPERPLSVTAGRPKRQIQPNRLYPGKEFLVSGSANTQNENINNRNSSFGASSKSNSKFQSSK